MKRFRLVLVLYFVFNLFSFSLAEEKESNRDYLYSEAYFDYLIECASEQYNIQQEKEKKQKKQNEEIINQALEDDEVTMFEIAEEDSNLEPFKLRIESDLEVNPYSESLKVENSKTSIGIAKNLNLVQDALVFRNKYNSQDYRVLAGFEYTPSERFFISGGLETNYRGNDQNPTSRKLYFAPTIKLSDKLSLSFYNKYNSQTKTSDHDLSLNFSPFKSNAADFRIYAGYTNEYSGKQSRSINFYTNFYFY